jgi:methylated-DNA-[protein]-cysteine S-methyltransferase
VTHHRYAAEGWGVGELWIDDGVLVLHELAGTFGGSPSPGTPPPHPSAVANDVATDLCRRFAAHLAGAPTSYDDVAVDESGLSPFQRELLAALRSVPWGEVVSYGELAERAGRPRAARAAGTFCAGNQHALVVPCHRVIASDGIGGYGSTGVEVKRRLLALEGVTV